MQILIFEAITGGRLLGTDEVPTGSLLNEGLSMTAALCVDLLASHRSSNTCVQQLIGQAIPKDLQAEEDIQVTCFWDARLDQEHGDSRSGTIPSLLSHAIQNANSIVETNPNTRVDKQTSRHSIAQRKPDTFELLHRFDTFTTTQQWMVNNSSQSARPNQPPLNGKIHVTSIQSNSELVEALQQAVNQFDCVILIAPEPTLSDWAKLLDRNSDSLFNLPIELLRQAQSKRNYSSPPWASFNLADGKYEWRDFRWETDQALVIKPDASCGATDVWKLQPPAGGWSLERETLLQAVSQNLSTSGDGKTDWLLMPWSNGTPVSVAFLPTPDGLFQFPPCEQIISLVPEHTEVSGNHTRAEKCLSTRSKINYIGSRWAEPQIRETIEHALPEIMRQLIPATYRNQLRGWFGIDLLVEGNHIDVVDFNGRWTSSYNLIRNLQFMDQSSFHS